MIVRWFCILACVAMCAACTSDSCTVDGDCAQGQRCISQRCRDTGGGTGLIGAACQGDTDCASGLSCRTDAQGYPSGMCSHDCPATACEAGSTCATAGGTQTCATSCTSATSCRSGYDCCGGACLPSGLCPAAPGCAKPVVASTLPAAQVQALGAKTVGTKVTFNVPANTASVTIVQQARGAVSTINYNGTTLDNSAVPATISEPDGTVAYDDSFCDTASPDGGAPEPSSGCPSPIDPETAPSVFAGDTPTTAAFTVPNTAAALSRYSGGLPQGAWSFVVNDYAAECTVTAGCTGGSATGTYDVSVLTKPLPAAAHLDFAFYIVGTATGTLGTLTAATAPNEPRVARMIATLKSLFGNAGVTVRNVSFYDVSAADKSRYGTSISADETGPCSDLDQMFTLSGAHPGNTLHLFLVQSLRSSSTSGGTTVGIDGTIPGPSTLSGTVHSGAAVSMANLFSGTCLRAAPDLGCGADLVAYIAAHESGHFLGLFHITESDGKLFDPLTDTPKCPCLSCSSSADRPKCTQANGDPVLDAVSCNAGGSCAGGPNLMFWQLSDGVSQGVLSAQQAQLIKINPLLQ